MNEFEVTRDLDLAIERLTAAKSNIAAIVARNDYPPVRKVCSAVEEFADFVQKYEPIPTPAKPEPYAADNPNPKEPHKVKDIHGRPISMGDE